MAVIRSILDTDLYKFTMQQAVLHQFPGVTAKFKFKCRNQKADLHSVFGDLTVQLQALAGLRLSPQEEAYLRTIRFLKPDYIDFLKQFRFDPKYVSIRQVFEPPGGLEIIIEGPWLQTILFEVPLLAIINELYYQGEMSASKTHAGYLALEKKVQILKEYKPGIEFLEFGTRRRFSKSWQQRVIQFLNNANCGLIGTSNVMHAMDLNLKPMGTMAHEFLQAAQALGTNLRDSQKFALQAWVNEYRGDLGIALTDVIGMKAFLRDFDLYFAKLYDGGRHDSGDPFLWGREFIDHYLKLKIDPMTKTGVWSDNLTFPLAVKLDETFRHELGRRLFGIGTYLTNDFGPDHERLDIVIKMIECNGLPVAKLSDSQGKNMCESQEFETYLRKTFQRC